jgi:tetratricopeptide (TPR) repeat protein
MRWCVAAVMVCALSGAAPVSAADDQVRQCFEEGSQHYHLGEFADAAKTYKRCYKLRPDAIFLYNIGQCYRLAGDLQNALFFYRSYLTSAVNAENQREVEERIRTLESELAAQKAPPNSPVPPPAMAVSTPVTVTPALTVAAPETRRAQPTYKKWWVWTTVSLAAAGIGLGVGLGLGLGLPGEPQTRLGTQPVF